MAAMSAVSPVCLRAPAPSARKSRAGRMSSRVAAPAALRTSAVTGRRAQGMSVSAPPLSRRFRAYPRPERVSRGSHAARRAPIAVRSVVIARGYRLQKLDTSLDRATEVADRPETA